MASDRDEIRPTREVLWAESARLAIQAEVRATEAARAILRSGRLLAQAEATRGRAREIRRRACGPCRRAAAGKGSRA